MLHNLKDQQNPHVVSRRYINQEKSYHCVVAHGMLPQSSSEFQEILAWNLQSLEPVLSQGNICSKSIAGGFYQFEPILDKVLRRPSRD